VKAILKTIADVSDDRSIGLIVGDSVVNTSEQGKKIDAATKSSAGKRVRSARLDMNTVVEQSPAPTGEIVQRSKVG